LKITKSELEDYIHNEVTNCPKDDKSKRPVWFASLLNIPIVQCTADEESKLRDERKVILEKQKEIRNTTPKEYYANILKGF
ncbi:hypothetical protein OMF50_21330, partial [Bordetella pertussis]